MSRNSLLYDISVISLVVLSCGVTRSTGCIEERRISNDLCTLEYNPVCGCDGKTYGNPCQAGHAGLISWTKGVCKGGTSP